MTGATAALAIAVFAAASVEFVEAVTIVMAMGMTRSWRSAAAGTGVALVALAAFTAAAGYAIVTWLPQSLLQLVIGGLLLIFGMQWLRKAVLRSSGRKKLHDEAASFAKKSAAAREAEQRTVFGLDYFAFFISLKGVFLEGVEVVFIVITFGLNAKNVPVAVAAAAAALVVVTSAAFAVRKPLTRVPENTLKYGVSLMLCTFGSFWLVEGLGVFRSGGESMDWPGGEVSLVVVLAAWLGLSRVLIRGLRTPPGAGAGAGAGAGSGSGAATTTTAEAGRPLG